MRIMPSCREVRNNSPSRLMLICRSARGAGLPMALVDQIAKRHVDALAAGVADVELNLFDRRDRLRNAVVGLFHRGEVGDKHASVEDVAENELAFQRSNAPVIGEAVGDRARPSS